MKKKLIGIALGGGGARGFAHIGVLKVFEEAGINIDFIAGTSMGAIIGGMYAQNPDISVLTKRIKDFFNKGLKEHLGLKYIKPQQNGNSGFLTHFTKVVSDRIILNFALSKKGILHNEKLYDVISELVDEQDISKMKIPFCALATDLTTGNTIEYKEGSLIKALTLSSSIPGFITPEFENKMLITDGGVTAPVPVKYVKNMGADAVIGVSVDMKNYSELQSPNIINIISRANSARGLELSNLQLEMADVRIHPDIDNAHWSEFERLDEFIEVGEKAAREKLKEIKKINSNIFTRFFN